MIFDSYNAPSFGPASDLQLVGHKAERGINGEQRQGGSCEIAHYCF